MNPIARADLLAEGRFQFVTGNYSGWHASGYSNALEAGGLAGDNLDAGTGDAEMGREKGAQFLVGKLIEGILFGGPGSQRIPFNSNGTTASLGTKLGRLKQRLRPDKPAGAFDQE